MIKRLIKINNNLYRGSAPSPKDVIALYKHFGIRKIVSLDGAAGHTIDKICKMLGIEHIIIPIDEIKPEPLIKLFSYDLYDLLMSGGPTFVHCMEGKDRTGMVIAMFKCKYMDVPCKDAINEAEKIGFGIGVRPTVIRAYKAIICAYCNDKECCTHKEDINDIDIADNARHHGDFMDGVIDAATMQSFAPFMDTGRQYPYYSQIYNYWYDQYPTRNNRDLKPEFDLEEKEDQVPMVGVFDSPARSVGPVDNGGGFVSI